jgi:hypothetical protein
MKYMMMAAMLIGLPALPALAQKAGTTGIQLSVQERQAQQAWWTKRAERKAERRMTACLVMPACMDRRDRRAPRQS